MNDFLKEFYARGGKVRKLAEGERALNMTNAQWRRQTQMTKAERAVSDFEVENAAELRHERVSQARIAGGMRAAYDELNA